MVETNLSGSRSDNINLDLEKFVAFSFSSSNDGAACHYPTSLSPLLDDSSSYASVARVCLGLSQYASSGCCSTCEVCYPAPSCFSTKTSSSSAHVTGAYLWNESHVQKQVSVAIKSLTVCVSNHKLDSCRMAATKCLAILARTAFFRARTSDNNDPLLVTNTPSHMIKAMEDECAVDVPQVLCNLALDDVSDTVSASAFWSLGILLCATTEIDDIMSSYIQQVALFNNNYNTTKIDNLGFQDMHHMAVGMDFKIRILSNVVVKRLRQLLHRASTLKPQQLQIQTLPFLTCCIQQFTSKALTTSNNIVPGMISLPTYAKRWFSADTILLQDDFVQTMLLPRMLSCTHGPLAVACAESFIRLLSTSLPLASSSKATWIVHGCSAACNVLLQSLKQKELLMGESKATIIALIIAATQVLPWENQMTILLGLFSDVSHLPVESEDEVISNYKHKWFLTDSSCGTSVKSRIGLLTECIVQMMIGCCLSKEMQAATIGITLLTSHPIIVSSITERKNLYHGLVQRTSRKQQQHTDTREVHFAEEFVLSVTNCLFQMIRTSHYCNSTSTALASVTKSGGGKSHSSTVFELVDCSLILLNTFASCLTWRFCFDTNTDYVDEIKKLGCDAVGQSYLDLLELCLSITGLIEYSLTTNSQNSKQPNAHSTLQANLDVKLKLRQIVQKNYQLLVDEGIPCNNVKIRLLHLFAIYLARTTDEPQQNYYDYARTILRFVGGDISSLLFSQSYNSRESKSKAHLLEKYITIVELTASSACDKLPGSKLCSEIVRLSLEALQSSSRKEEALDEQNLQIIISSATRIKNKFERIPNNNSSVPLWVFAVSKSEDDKQSIESGVSSAAGVITQNALSQNSCSINYSFDKDGDASLSCFCNAAEMRRFLYWRCAQRAVRSRVSAVLASFGNELNNDSFRNTTTANELAENKNVTYNASIIGGGSMVSSNNLMRNIKQRKPICLAVDEQHLLSLTLSSIGAGFCKRKTGSYPFVGWKDSITTLTGSSDPIVAMLSYSTKQSSSQQNITGGKKPCLVVTIRIFNVTAVPITRGLSLNLSVCHLSSDHDSFSHNHVAMLSDNIAGKGELLSSTKRVPLTCCSASFKGEIKPYDSITLGVEIDCDCPGDLELHTEVTFREVHSEEPHHCFQQVSWGSSTIHTDPSAVDNIPCNGDGESSTTSFGCISSLEGEDKDNDENEFMDVLFSFEPVVIPSVVKLLPCSLVFFKERKGDFNMFEVIWAHMTVSSSSFSSRTQLKHATSEKGQKRSKDLTNGPAAKLLSQQANLTHNSTDVAGTITSQKVAWAFMDWSGHRLLCRLLNEDTGARKFTAEVNSSIAYLEMRCDDIVLLTSILASHESSSRFVADLTNGFWLPN